jgi:hypothetical protein
MRGRAATPGYFVVELGSSSASSSSRRRWSSNDGRGESTGGKVAGQVSIAESARVAHQKHCGEVRAGRYEESPEEH